MEDPTRGEPEYDAPAVTEEPADVVLRDDRLVEAALAEPSNDPSPTSAPRPPCGHVWSRLTTSTAPGDTAARQLLATDLHLEGAAQIMATPVWPHIGNRVRSDQRGGNPATPIQAAAALSQV